jgi:hypothetical protein
VGVRGLFVCDATPPFSRYPHRRKQLYVLPHFPSNSSCPHTTTIAQVEWDAEGALAAPYVNPWAVQMLDGGDKSAASELEYAPLKPLYAHSNSLLDVPRRSARRGGSKEGGGRGK